MASSDSTSTALSIALKVIRDTGEAVPVGGGIIKAIAGISLTILETATVRYTLLLYLFSAHFLAGSPVTQR